MSSSSPSSSPDPEWTPSPQRRSIWHKHTPKAFDIPAYFYPSGAYSLSGIATRAGILGFVLNASLVLAVHLFRRDAYFQLPLFVASLCVFHFLEFWVTARYNTRKAKVSSYLLTTNGMAYNLAHTAACIEGLVELWCWPQMKGSRWALLLGVGLILAGQVARTLAMAHAGTNFSHLVACRREEDHVLVKTGIYSYMRHPSYFGFFWWGLGTQIMLGNPICFVGYSCVLWNFFNSRIRGEEELLVEFFEDEYQEYRARTPTLIPFIK